MLFGRVREQAAIEALLERARGGGLVLRGEPGIGKSTLLGYAAERASGMRVLHTVGVEPESDLGHATLHRLLLPVLDSIHQLPEPQARALSVVFGQADGPAPDRFLVALATLSLLSEAACERPVLCLVDDAHWADAPSLDALAFVARRLEVEPIALVLAARADEGRPEPLPLAAGLRRAFLERARQRDPAAQWLLLLVAADGSGRRDTIQRAARLRLGSDLDPQALDELDDLIADDGFRLAFRHPLIRSAIYHGTSPDERRAAHRALAAALDTEPAELDRRAWQLGQAASGPDEPAAEDLLRVAPCWPPTISPPASRHPRCGRRARAGRPGPGDLVVTVACERRRQGSAVRAKGGR